jgi:hypothetical protein
MIYLASPYSHPDPAVRQQRYASACQATAALLRQGCMVVSPIVNSHPLVAHGLPADWSFWQRYDQEIMTHCDGLAVLTLDGWQESCGVQAEIDLAAELGIPIDYLSPEIISKSSGGLTSISERPLSQEISI